MPVSAKIRINTQTLLLLLYKEYKAQQSYGPNLKCAGTAEEWEKETLNHNFHQNKSPNMECWSLDTCEVLQLCVCVSWEKYLSIFCY